MKNVYKQRHLSQSVVMVRPNDFGYNEQTGEDNEFQHRPDASQSSLEIKDKALAEFDDMALSLDNKGIEVLSLETPQRSVLLPDAIFPNNWFSTRDDGSLIIYPMKTENRRAEVQVKELSKLLRDHGYQINKTIDLRNFIQILDDADQQHDSLIPPVLEGTGSLIFHHQQSDLYAAISERCEQEALAQYAEQFNYHLFPMTTQSFDGKPIYHTNVLMSCGESFAVFTTEVMAQGSGLNEKVFDHLKNSFKDVIEISEQQMTESFCGNILQLQNSRQQKIILMSNSAYHGFTDQQIRVLEKHGEFVICNIPTIEYIGGGSCRCMVAENFLPRA